MERIYQLGEFSERGVNMTWAPVGSAFVKQVDSKDVESGRDVVFETPEGEQRVVVSAKELIPRSDPRDPASAIAGANPVAVASYELSDDSDLLLVYTNTRRVWRRNTRGDYWIRDRKNDVFRKLGGDFAPEASLQFAKISPDGTRVGYVCNNNVYVEDILSGKNTQLTFDGSRDVINGTFDWVYEEEFDCRDGFRWSPDGKQIAFWRLDSSREPEFAMLDGVGLSTTSGASRMSVAQLKDHLQISGQDASVSDDVSEEDNFSESVVRQQLDAYPTLVFFKYPRVGCANADVSIGVVTLPELGNTADWDAKLSTRFVEFDDPDEYYLPSMEWYGDGVGLIVQKTPRSQRRCDVYSINPDTLEPALLFSETDPDGAWQTVYPIYVFHDGNRFLRVSEHDGWTRYYLTSFSDLDSQTPITLASADAIDFVAFDYDEEGEERGIYYYASPDNATQRFLYWASLTGENKRVEISGDTSDVMHERPWGFETWSVSADSNFAICRRSAFGTPTRIDLVRLDGPLATEVRLLQDNNALREKLAQQSFGPVEFFQVEISERCDFEEPSDEPEARVSVDGWAILPDDWDPTSPKKYPVLVYVYGEPAGQTVLDSWGGSTYMYHRAIAQRGCVVLSFDVRGTPAPKGRKWRKRVYQKFGAVGRSDQAAAFRSLIATASYANKLDLERVGVWGWSGGGTSTLNMMFNYPDLYKCGVAVAPVADYRNYDTIYQERYSGLITETPESYELGSAITYADKLEGRLLIIHGSGDDNCHYQTTERLINLLIAHGKDFEAFAYPFRSHGIFEGAGTTLHLRKKTMKFWEQNLLNPASKFDQ
ncbi:MAG: DPP IV N-terminal domain-containing protein [Thermoguttaceae bacterium]|jgi:dipeptidyl-peptidase-4